MLGARAYLWAKSKYRLRGLFSQDVARARSVEDFPRNIFIFWDKGREAAPHVCELCIRSWEELNPGWTVTVLDQAAADAILPRSSFPESISINHYANMLRLTLLRQYGGVWADATLLCVKPADDWLLPLLQQSDFFVFSRPGPDRIMSNWFIASRPASALLETLLQQYHRYWNTVGGAPKPYFWFHYIFEYLTKSNAAFRKEWQEVARIGADPLHRLQRRFAGVVDEADALAIVPFTSVQKLNHRTDAGVEDYLAFLGKMEWPYLARVTSRPFDGTSLALA